MIKIGELETIKKGLYEDEEGAVYQVLEVNQDRAVLEFVTTNLTIRPQSIANIAELEVVTKSTDQQLAEH